MATGKAPLTAVQLLWVNLIMDTLGALALATEPPNDDLLKKKAIGRKGNFISNVMWRNIIGQVIYQLIVLGFLQYKSMDILHLDGTEKEMEDQLNTMIFNAFVFCQVSTLLPISCITTIDANAHQLGRGFYLHRKCYPEKLRNGRL